MARYPKFPKFPSSSDFSSIAIGGMACCNINGRSISIVNGEVYVDGVHYVPEGTAGSEGYKPFTPGKMVEHKFEVSPDFNAIRANGFLDVVFNPSENDEDFEVKGVIPENLIDMMDVRVEYDTLYIGIKSSFINMQLPSVPTIYVTHKTLNGKTGADWDSAPEQTGTLLMRQS